MKVVLKTKGILIFDDYEWKLYENPLLQPKLAIDTFLEVYKNQYKIINKGYQIVLQKFGDNILKKKIGNDIGNNENQKKIKLIQDKYNRAISDLNIIQSSKTYKIWQLYNKAKKQIFKSKNK